MTERRSNGRFAKGCSGNPGGRPKQVAEVRELARQHTEAAIARLVAIVENPKSSDAAAVSAAREILDRGYGRSEQSTKVDATMNSSVPPPGSKPDMAELLAMAGFCPDNPVSEEHPGPQA